MNSCLCRVAALGSAAPGVAIVRRSPSKAHQVKLTRYRRLVQEATLRTGGGARQSGQRDNCYAPQVAKAWRAPSTRAETLASRRFEPFAPAAANRIPRAGQAA